MTEEKKEKTSKEEKGEAKDVSDSSSDASEKASSVEVPAKFKKIVSEIEEMTVLELHELVKVFEEKFDVSAQAAAAPAVVEGVGEEKDSFTVELKSIGEQKIAVIKVVKEVLGLGLKDAKDMVDGAPTVLKEDVKKEEAEEIKTKIESAGGSIELK